MRSPAFERAWFEQVARSAGRWIQGNTIERFFDEVNERLDKGAEEYSDSWASRPLVELIREAAEEGADIPAWLTLAAQSLNREAAGGLLDSEDAADIQMRFVRASALALLAHEELSKAKEDYRRARAESRWRSTVPAAPPPSLYFED